MRELAERYQRHKSPAAKIARLLREAERIAGDNNFTVASGQFRDEAKIFEEFKL